MSIHNINYIYFQWRNEVNFKKKNYIIVTFSSISEIVSCKDPEPNNKILLFVYPHVVISNLHEY